MTDIRTALKNGMEKLHEARVPSHTLAAELLLMHATQRDRVWLYAHAEESLDATTLNDYFALIARRAEGVPTQYLTGKQEFWGLEFHVEPGVLIPRPETEHVIEVALERIAQRKPRRIADAGTGSGCLAVSLAREFPDAEIYATDISPDALRIARLNAERHGVASRIHFIECNLLEALLSSPLNPRPSSFHFDLIVSNPPYIGRREEESLPREVREHEPGEALYGGEVGAELYAALIEQAGALLVPGGLLVLELGYNSLPYVYPLLDDAGGHAGPPLHSYAERSARMWDDVRITHDLAGIPRVISAVRS